MVTDFPFDRAGIVTTQDRYGAGPFRAAVLTAEVPTLAAQPRAEGETLCAPSRTRARTTNRLPACGKPTGETTNLGAAGGGVVVVGGGGGGAVGRTSLYVNTPFPSGASSPID